MLRAAEMKTELKNLASQQADLYRVLSNATRLRILWTLADQELSVGEIAAAAETSLQNTSQHLHLMQDKGILTSRREAQTIYYRITTVSPMVKWCGVTCPLFEHLFAKSGDEESILSNLTETEGEISWQR
jgi:DNA-binding transcriptional ArsR family regulator